MKRASIIYIVSIVFSIVGYSFWDKLPQEYKDLAFGLFTSLAWVGVCYICCLYFKPNIKMKWASLFGLSLAVFNLVDELFNLSHVSMYSEYFICFICGITCIFKCQKELKNHK